MPNNVENKLTATGSAVDVKKLVKLMTTAENQFDFNQIRRMPDELRNVHTGRKAIDGKDVKNWLELDGKAVAIPEATLAKWLKKFGAVNWYDWGLDNWGTKWNAYGDPKPIWTISTFQDGSAEAEICFDTAWGSPEKLIAELAKKFPNVEITVEVGGEVDDPYTYSFND